MNASGPYPATWLAFAETAQGSEAAAVEVPVPDESVHMVGLQVASVLE